MKISGFTVVKNATKLYYPIRASIESILPLVDEFVVALGDCDLEDDTRAEIEAIGSSKIRIIDTVWDLEKYPHGTETAHQTDIAKSYCRGDWLFYLQADEVMHEAYLEVIRSYCERFLEDKEVEGFVFDYLHFWGSYDYHQIAHGWYKKEIRIVRNDPEIHSWEDAQSFRRIPDFDGLSYRKKQGTSKLHVVAIPAKVYHYGWVRPPDFMQTKKREFETMYHGEEEINEVYKLRPGEFDYGPLGRARRFEGTHPAVMQPVIAKFDWGHKLNYTTKELNPNREMRKHDHWRNRVVTWIEQRLLAGKELGGFKNYILLKK